jgi:hypothetical protein
MLYIKKNHNFILQLIIAKEKYNKLLNDKK